MRANRRAVMVVLAASATALTLAPSTGAAGGTPAVQIPIQILRGPNGQALAVASVTIQAHAYRFVVDTGASGSLISRRVARALTLPKVGKLQRARSATCTSASQAVQISGWKLGGLTLASRRIDSSKFNLGPDVAVVGLLGSDVLSSYGKVSVDYTNSVLTLGG